MSTRVINRPWTNEDIGLLQEACEAYGTSLPKDPREHMHWTDQELEPVINACRAKVTELGRLLQEAEESIQGMDLIEGVKPKYDKYREFHEVFGGQDPNLLL